jgi:Spy/CpxP family protein refolding chaperone
MKAIAAISLLALMVSGATMLSYAQAPMGFSPGMHGGHGPMGHMFHDLDLTDAQKAQVKSIMDANKTNMHTLMQQMAQTRLALLQATANGAYDAAKIQALAAQQAQLQAAMTVQHEALQHQVYTQVLTADQRTKFDQHVSDEISRMTERLQKMATQGQAAPEQ